MLRAPPATKTKPKKTETEAAHEDIPTLDKSKAIANEKGVSNNSSGKVQELPAPLAAASKPKKTRKQKIFKGKNLPNNRCAGSDDSYFGARWF